MNERVGHTCVCLFDNQKLYLFIDSDDDNDDDDGTAGPFCAVARCYGAPDVHGHTSQCAARDGAPSGEAV